MEQDEVSRYVLGALRAIRKELHKKALNEMTGWVLMGGMVFLGLRFFSRYRSKENNLGLWAYLLCLPALGWAVALLGNMESNVVFTSSITQSTWVGLAISLFSLILGGQWLKKNTSLHPPAP
jgi:lipid-A-disaccharide synthase-like uncharacterized protein